MVKAYEDVDQLKKDGGVAESDKGSRRRALPLFDESIFAEGREEVRQAIDTHLQRSRKLGWRTKMAADRVLRSSAMWTSRSWKEMFSGI